MRKIFVVALMVGVGALVASAALADEKKGGKDGSVRVLDDCDPNDPAWEPTGGCTLKGGVVSFEEFGAFLFSPLSAGSPVGHPAWRMSPTYFRIDPDEDVSVRNEGGRVHTFTEVAAFGGGFVTDLNGTLEKAPECDTAAPLPPGAKLNLKGLSVGNHSFQCCIHPWMRMLIKVEAEEDSENHRHH